MPNITDTKITDNSNELSFHQLTGTTSILQFPLFQRAYVWTQRQLDRLISEVETIVDGQDSSRFLGAIISVTRLTNPSLPTPNEIVDGQQRLTTMYLFLLAAAQVAAKEGESDYARGLISTNLIVDWAQNLESNTKLTPSISDRGQFRAIFDRLIATGDLSDWLPVKLRLPPAIAGDAGPNGPLYKQFSRIQKYLQKQYNEQGFERVEALVEVVRNQLTFVFILLKDPGSATTVFEGLNDPGVPISVGDLVKNEVFSRVGHDDNDAVVLHEQKWIPFRERFQGTFDEFFFPYAVTQKSNTSRTAMFGEFRAAWRDLNAGEIIQRLEQYAAPFLSIRGMIDPAPIFGKGISDCIGRLLLLKSPTSIYPFVMQLLHSLQLKQIAKKDVIGCLEAIESFLARRALCGIEPTGLLGLFRTMWSNTQEQPTRSNVEDVILKRQTVEWPNDDRLRNAIFTRPLYKTSAAKYAILEYDRSLGIDYADQEATIEHVLPQSYAESWEGDFSKKEHQKLRHLWANLIPLSTEMNGNLSTKAYSSKREILKAESKYISARQLAENYDSWRPADIQNRSNQIYDWAIDRWGRPAPTS